MWRLWIALIVLVMVISVPCGVAFAKSKTEVNLSVTATPNGGITDFTITYVSDTQLDLSWALFGDATNIMIRAKYGQYPENIPDAYTAPSDGYLVYSGNGTSVSDTSMDFNQNFGGLYYCAWAQRADGTWYTNLSTGWKESKEMVLLFFGLIVVGMTYVGLKTTYFLLSVLSGFLWAGLLAYWKANLPSGITAGSATDTIMLILCIAFCVALIFRPFWVNKFNSRGQETGGGWHIPFQNTEEQEQEEAQRRVLPTRTERTTAYYDRINSALRGERRRR